MPRYWGTWCFFIFLWVVMWMPRCWVMKLGAFVGDQIRLRNSKRRHIVEVNIGLCFPNLTTTEQTQLVVEHFRCYGCGLVDMGLSMMGTKAHIEKFSDVEGFEHIESLSKTRKGILITYHTTTLDMCSSSMLAEVDLVTMMKRDKNPLINWFLYKARTRYQRAIVLMRDQSLRGIVEGIREGRVCYIVPDEDFGDGKHADFAPFFGQQRSTLNIVSRLAKASDAVVLPSLCRLVRETGRYKTTVLPALSNFPSGDYVVDATIMNGAMEKLILQAPEQYLWTFRWFRTRENGQPDPYA
jgi:KDO2-lipid IV(A) lauroyltransferase